MIREFFYKKYGKYITERILSPENEVIWDNYSQDSNDQIHVRNHLLQLGELVPSNFLNDSVEWGMDFSSWIDKFDRNKDYLFIGSEPHLNTNFQLVYDFGNRTGRTLQEIAKFHYDRENDIWHYLTNIFVSDISVPTITEFLSKCYITDLCHLVPKNCGQVPSILNKLSINNKDWSKFRTNIAKRFLLEEIDIVNPKFIILHGEPARSFFNKELGAIYSKTDLIEESNWKILSGEFRGYKIISIPHLKGDMRNKLWKCKRFPKRPLSAKQIIIELTNNK
jgi:hypothetical protein